jgi:cell division protein FtsI/penicillin-binding protein 2
MFLRNDDLPRGTRLSLRIAVLGGVAVALFAVLFFRLWNLQVIDRTTAPANTRRRRHAAKSSPATANRSSRTGPAWRCC